MATSNHCQASCGRMTKPLPSPLSPLPRRPWPWPGPLRPSPNDCNALRRHYQAPLGHCPFRPSPHLAMAKRPVAMATPLGMTKPLPSPPRPLPSHSIPNPPHPSHCEATYRHDQALPGHDHATLAISNAPLTCTNLHQAITKPLATITEPPVAIAKATLAITKPRIGHNQTLPGLTKLPVATAKPLPNTRWR